MNTASDIPVRFTTQGKVLFATLLAEPRDQFVLPGLQAAPGTRIDALGSDKTLEWTNSSRGLRIRIGDSALKGKHAFAFRIDPLPQRL